MKKTIKLFIRNSLDILYVAYLKSLKTDNFLPLHKWIKIRKYIGLYKSEENPLWDKLKKEICIGADIKFLPQGALIENDVIGVWTLSKSVMEFILGKLLDEKPEFIIECGSGISTILLAHYASLKKIGDVAVSIISLEQNKCEAEITEIRLRELGLNGYVTVVHAPIDDYGNYNIDEQKMQSIFAIKKADCIIIDGPYGPPGCRISTLPILSQFCGENARWYLDDALRDGELNALVTWDRLDGVCVEGIYPFNKGLGVGRLNCWRDKL